MTSNFIRKSGIQKEWITSSLYILNRTARPAGSTITGTLLAPSGVVSGEIAPLGYVAVQFHFMAFTTISIESAGATSLSI